ncbi:hypothetical protein LZ31DRAFT_4896 [Colletotrichum somersetense]|nr:hypothetical protein LZ31DRAFT_4896 [Colletotrichum somersetense]
MSTYTHSSQEGPCAPCADPVLAFLEPWANPSMCAFLPRECPSSLSPSLFSSSMYHVRCVCRIWEIRHFLSRSSNFARCTTLHHATPRYPPANPWTMRSLTSRLPPQPSNADKRGRMATRLTSDICKQQLTIATCHAMPCHAMPTPSARSLRWQVLARIMSRPSTPSSPKLSPGPMLETRRRRQQRTYAGK